MPKNTKTTNKSNFKVVVTDAASIEALPFHKLRTACSERDLGGNNADADTLRTRLYGYMGLPVPGEGLNRLLEHAIAARVEFNAKFKAQNAKFNAEFNATLDAQNAELNAARAKQDAEFNAEETEESEESDGADKHAAAPGAAPTDLTTALTASGPQFTNMLKRTAALQAKTMAGIAAAGATTGATTTTADGDLKPAADPNKPPKETPKESEESEESDSHAVTSALLDKIVALYDKGKEEAFAILSKYPTPVLKALMAKHEGFQEQQKGAYKESLQEENPSDKNEIYEKYKYHRTVTNAIVVVLVRRKRAEEKAAEQRKEKEDAEKVEALGQKVSSLEEDMRKIKEDEAREKQEADADAARKLKAEEEYRARFASLEANPKAAPPKETPKAAALKSAPNKTLNAASKEHLPPSLCRSLVADLNDKGTSLDSLLALYSTAFLETEMAKHLSIEKDAKADYDEAWRMAQANGITQTFLYEEHPFFKMALHHYDVASAIKEVLGHRRQAAKVAEDAEKVEALRQKVSSFEEDMRKIKENEAREKQEADADAARKLKAEEEYRARFEEAIERHDEGIAANAAASAANTEAIDDLKRELNGTKA